jgi:hypothetical protein
VTARPPGREEIVELGRALGLGIGAEEAEKLRPLLEGALVAWAALDALPDGKCSPRPVLSA